MMKYKSLSNWLKLDTHFIQVIINIYMEYVRIVVLPAKKAANNVSYFNSIKIHKENLSDD
jgi:hypothetical protein